MSIVSQEHQTCYEILGVSETASLAEIKSSHRALARVLHPDKSSTIPSPRFTIDTGERSSLVMFREIQMAWECLRDPSKRISYDESLRRKREKRSGRFDEAQLVKLSEMAREICDVEIIQDDKQDEPILQQQNLYTYVCRCGDKFEILDEDLLTTNGKAGVWECQSCTLAIKVCIDRKLSTFSTTDGLK